MYAGNVGLLAVPRPGARRGRVACADRPDVVFVDQRRRLGPAGPGRGSGRGPGQRALRRPAAQGAPAPRCSPPPTSTWCRCAPGSARSSVPSKLYSILAVGPAGASPASTRAPRWPGRSSEAGRRRRGAARRPRRVHRGPAAAARRPRRGRARWAGRAGASSRAGRRPPRSPRPTSAVRRADRVPGPLRRSRRTAGPGRIPCSGAVWARPRSPRRSPRVAAGRGQASRVSGQRTHRCFPAAIAVDRACSASSLVFCARTQDEAAAPDAPAPRPGPLARRVRHRHLRRRSGPHEPT